MMNKRKARKAQSRESWKVEQSARSEKPLTWDDIAFFYGERFPTAFRHCRAMMLVGRLEETALKRSKTRRFG
jgi:hypothetical protein